MVEILTEAHKEVERLVDEGIRALNKKSLSEASQLFQSAYEKNERDPRAISYWGYILALHGGKPRRGLELCQQAIRTDHVDSMFYRNLRGVAYSFRYSEKAGIAFSCSR